jgi:hypothetical protein
MLQELQDRNAAEYDFETSVVTYSPMASGDENDSPN